MHHAFADKYSDLKSPVHVLDPRVKLLGCIVLLLSVALTPVGRYRLFAGWGVLLVLLIAASRVPPLYVLKKAMIVLPFVLVVAVGLPFLREGETIAGFTVGGLTVGITDGGMMMFGTVMVKSYLATVSLVILSATTRFARLIEGLHRMRAPRILILILSFMYRYLFVLVDEAELIDRARKARTPAGTGFRQMRVLAAIIGLLFVRTFERAERVYQSMLSRGFRGDPPASGTLKLAAGDAAAGAFVLTAVGLVWGLG